MNIKEIIKYALKKYPKIEYKIIYYIYEHKSRKFSHMSDADEKDYLNSVYNGIFSRNIDWQNPIYYTEKIQCFKMFNRDNDIYARLTDKYEVREWVKDKIGEEYLIPLIGVYDSFEEIDYDLLPNQFVIKCNHDSGSVIVVKDKNKKQWNELKYKYTYHLRTDFSKHTFEKHYSLIKPKIIIEELIGDGNIQDYKFLCFNSKVYYCWVDIDRFGNHKRNVYDLEWNLQPWNQMTYGNSEYPVNKPKNLHKMIEICNVLCDGFAHVRVDLYNINGKIYFGEMTFTNGSGFEWLDDKTDEMLGRLWDI